MFLCKRLLVAAAAIRQRAHVLLLSQACLEDQTLIEKLATPYWILQSQV